MKKMSKFLVIVLFMLVTVSVPVTAWVVQQRTQTASKAAFETPSSLIPTENEAGLPDDMTSPSGAELKITLVWPFIGKVGDAVIIYGTGFGEDPSKAMVYFGNTFIPTEDIQQWSPNHIAFSIPRVPTGLLSAPIAVNMVGVSTEWDEPFMIYDTSTVMQVMKPLHAVETENIPDDYTVELYLDDGSMVSGSAGNSLAVPDGRVVVTVLVRNGGGVPQTFFVEPTEFGF